MRVEPPDFAQFFSDLHEKKPFPWQVRLAEQVCSDGWPDVIDLPTASGKTACIDIALFALACRLTAPRRIFFVVDRRVVVNEAYIRMQRIAKLLRLARAGLLGRVADRLRELAGGATADPIETCELRGGIYRDESWVKTPLQPTVIASTVDQVGSRLLFRGYGVSESVWPIHAGLVGNDALILLDEAHCSRAFAQTLRSVERYRGNDWPAEPVRQELHFVEMTATPSKEARTRVFQIGSGDKMPEHLGRRVFAPKPARLVVSRNKPKELDKLADTLCGEALNLAASVEGARRIAVMVNRVATARVVFAKLAQACGRDRVELLIGRMRPIDRDDLMGRLEPLKSGAERVSTGEARFVVATQCLEVGADLDFDLLVSECAGIDALLQRFGRLNRLGEFAGARGSIVIGTGQIEPKQPDPVYGNALAKTWGWLNEIAGPSHEVSMGIEAPESQAPTAAQMLRALPEEKQAELRIATPCAPVLLPSHLDAWVQTNPRPHCEPLIELFLHGPKRGEPEVQVVWRADLDESEPDSWADVVSLCPPVAAEAMPVPISEFRRWFSKQGADDAASDLEGAPAAGEDGSQDREGRCAGLVWRGEKSPPPIRFARDIRPGDTIVLPVQAQGWNELGHVPEGAAIDCGDKAQWIARRRLVLRLQPELLVFWPVTEAREEIIKLLSDRDTQVSDILEALARHRTEAPAANTWLSDSVAAALKEPRRLLRLIPYPKSEGFVLSSRRRVGTLEEDGGRDETSNTTPVILEEHLRDVEEAVGTYRELLGEKLLGYQYAARFHDCGKADIRFQAFLRSGDMMAARFAPKPLAKSGSFPTGPQDRRMQWEKSGLPDGFRHELISLLLTDSGTELNDGLHDLALHLIATHHGYCRPFAPVVLDTNAPMVSFEGRTLSCAERRQSAAHRLDSGVPDRFWRLIRRFGWWGLAYYEGLFRLADWSASARETNKAGQS